MDELALAIPEESPPEDDDLTEHVTLENFDETFRILQKKLEDERRLTLELQRKLRIEEQVTHNLQAKLEYQWLLRSEQTTELQLKLEEQLKCFELEENAGILESPEDALQESSQEKGDPKTDAKLIKLGLTEDILLALPFGYTIKIRSAFEKLCYQNDKLRMENDKLSSQNKKLNLENAELMKKNASQAREIDQLRRESRSLYEVLKNCPALSSSSSLDTQRRGNSDQLVEAEQGLSYEELKMRCDILSQMNTIAMLSGRLRTPQPESSVASTSPTFNDQDRS